MADAWIKKARHVKAHLGPKTACPAIECLSGLPAQVKHDRVQSYDRGWVGRDLPIASPEVHIIDIIPPKGTNEQ